jgi:phosphatidate phosphatase APP1
VGVQVFPGWAGQSGVHVGGRVLVQATPVPAVGGRTGTWPAVRANLAQFVTFEVPYARVRVQVGGCSTEVTADREGYLDTVLPDLALPPGRHAVTLTPLDPAGQPGTGTVHVSHPDADLAVVSDIDDTVIDSGVARGLVAIVATAVLRDSTTRVPLDGVPALYRALSVDLRSDGPRPFFYLSNSPWNLTAFLSGFLDRHGLPAGPLLLTDWGLGRRGLVRGERTHKLSALRRLADGLPRQRFVLLGDSGQEDTAIYTTFALEHPGRVAAVYVRRAGDTVPLKQQHLDDCGRRLGAAGVPFLLTEASGPMLDHARALGLVAGGPVSAH